MKKLSHYDRAGRATMVDVSAKSDTKRTAKAQAHVRIRPSVLKQLPQNPKGDPLEVARIAGIAASTVVTTGQTGVEMEALTAAAVAALTVYDMTKALDKSIEIQDLYLIEKTGGKSGDFRRWKKSGR